jgi:hypothetical protein
MSKDKPKDDKQNSISQQYKGTGVAKRLEKEPEPFVHGPQSETSEDEMEPLELFKKKMTDLKDYSPGIQATCAFVGLFMVLFYTVFAGVQDYLSYQQLNAYKGVQVAELVVEDFSPKVEIKNGTMIAEGKLIISNVGQSVAKEFNFRFSQGGSSKLPEPHSYVGPRDALCQASDPGSCLFKSHCRPTA